MSNRAWMPLHIDDYLSDTHYLSATEHGAYMLLIMHYWQQGGLPSDERLISRIARLSAEQWAESRDVLAMLFDDGWKHKRIEAELAKADDIIEKRRNAALARGTKSKPDASDEQVQSKSTYTGVPPRTNNQSSSLRSEERKRERDAFEEWYSHYPNKVQRGAAEKAFPKALKLATLEELIAGVERYVANKPPDRAYQNPSTWLNGKGWLDEPATQPRASPAKPQKQNSFAHSFLSDEFEDYSDDSREERLPVPTLQLVGNGR